MIENNIENLEKQILQELPDSVIEKEYASINDKLLFIDITLGSNYVTIAHLNGKDAFHVGKLNSNDPTESKICLDVKSAVYFLKQEFFNNN